MTTYTYGTIYQIHGEPALQDDGEGRTEKLGLHFVIVDLAMIEILEDITEEQGEKLKKNLMKSGLELLDHKRQILIDKIKTVIIEMIHHSDEMPQVNYSDYISKKIGMDYIYLISFQR